MPSFKASTHFKAKQKKHFITELRRVFALNAEPALLWRLYFYVNIAHL